MRDALKLRNNLFSEASSGLVASIARPLLVLFDRDFDLSVAVQHTFSYKPLVQDVLGMRLNRITVGKDASPGGVVVGDAPKKASYDVDEKDFFWETCGSLPFPKVAEEVENQLQNYKKAAEEVTRKSKGGSETVELDEHNTENLMSAVSSLPELTEKKKVIDKHFNIASALLEEIKGRTLNLYYNLEEDILTGKPDLAAVLELLKGNKGTHADRQRLALVCLLASDAMPTDSDLSQIEAALRESGADTTGFSYVRTLRKNNLAGGMKSASNFGALSQLAGSSQSNLLSWAEKTFGQGLSTVTKGVKNLLSGARRSPVVAALDSLMAGKSESGGPLDDFATFDPRGPPGGASDRSMGPYREAVVCMIGGGTYLEHEALQAWAASCASPRQVVYGATEILSAEAFLQQLADLGRQTSLP
eukprot:evm.model.scf_1298.4 EVM.evm.TU.scf_1298.4   scf_1298:28637-31515(-)